MADAGAAPLARAQDDVGDAVAVMGHELRAPVAALRLQLDVIRVRLQSGQPLARLEDGIEKMDSLLERLNRRIDEATETAQLCSSSARGVHFEEADLSRVVARVVDAVSQTAAQPFDLATPGPVYGAWNALSLSRAVDNLVDNAVKHGRTPVRVVVRSSPDVATVEVGDSGPGVGEHEESRIRRRYERGSASAAIPGWGLGLFVVEMVARAHGGKLEIAGTPGLGAVFRLCLPRHPDMP